MIVRSSQAVLVVLTTAVLAAAYPAFTDTPVIDSVPIVLNVKNGKVSRFSVKGSKFTTDTTVEIADIMMNPWDRKTHYHSDTVLRVRAKIKGTMDGKLPKVKDAQQKPKQIGEITITVTNPGAPPATKVISAPYILEGNDDNP
jgi:hypothetical protein